MIKKILISFFTGATVLLVTWIYQNYDFSFSVEDAFLKKVFFWKDKIYSSPSKYKSDIIFINTGKDLALVEDTVDYGNVAISDREKIYQFIHYINTIPNKPAFTVVDIQFYYPYTINPGVDSLLAKELKINDRLLIPLLKDARGNYAKPLYETRYAYSDYRTYGAVFNKFRILNQSSTPSIPIVMDQVMNNSVYKDHFFYSTVNGHLCLSSIWPSYYIKNGDVIKGVEEISDKKQITNERLIKEKVKKINTQFYNIGEILFDMGANPGNYVDFFKDRIVIIGNFEEDTHPTPVGKMSGSVVIANIYLSLLNGQHLVSFWFFLTLLIAFSAISYVALYKKIPEIKFNFKFVFSSYVVNFIRGYVSYFGCMFLLSILVLIVFNVQVALFLPSFIFTGIEYVRQKKYKSDK